MTNLKFKNVPLKVLCFAILFFSFQHVYGNEKNTFYNVEDFGAKGDNATINTKSIQNAINKCSADGGGTVIFPPGVFLSGTIQMLNNITLHLEAGAILKGSPNLADYTNIGRSSEENRNNSLIYSIGSENIAITGRGAIDGNDSAFFDWERVHPDCCFDPKYTRQGGKFENSFPDGPASFKTSGRPDVLVTMIECRNILMTGITVQNAPNWSVHLACCDIANVVAVNFQNSLLVPNADAIDVSNCKNVNISDCIIVAGDDGIAISPCADGYCLSETENINVSNCTITSRSAAIRIGWAAKAIRNCTFQNLVIYSNRGIGIFSKNDEIIENILFNNIIIHTRLHSGWWGIGDPIHISQIPLGTWAGLPQQLERYGEIRNIRFSNIEITSENSIVLYGYNGKLIKNIDFHNVRHYFKNSPLNDIRGGNFELRPAFDNKYSLFKHDIPAIYAKNVDGLTISDYTLDSDRGLPDYCTNAIFCEDFSNLTIKGFKGSPLSENPEYSTIHIENGNNATITDCTEKRGSETFLKHKNVTDCGFFMNNDMRKANIPIAPDKGFTIINNLK